MTSPAFAKTYATIRQGHTPAGPTVYDQSLDTELQQKIDKERADLEESKKGIVLLPEAERPAVLAAFKEAEERLAGPELIVAVGQSSFAVLADGSIMHWGMMTQQFCRVDGNDSAAAHWPIPLRIKGL